MNTLTQTHYVYRLYAGYDLLYVGCTSDPDGRLNGHMQTKPWWPQVTRWEFVGPLPKSDALILETALHDREQPRYSMSGRQVGRIAAAARLDNIAAAHEAGVKCPEPQCRRCRHKQAA